VTAPKTTKKQEATGAPRAAVRRPILGAIDLAMAALLLFGVWVALPARWWPADVIGSALALAFAVAGAGLVRGAPWARRAAIVAGWAGLGTGAVVVLGLALAAGHIAGLYGPVGAGGAILLTIVALLVLPYLVVLPAAQLWALARSAERE
jgi:hypothetical protein